MSIKSPGVSIIISADRASKDRYLLETINSIQQQSYRDFEILIFADRLSSQPREWYKELRDPRVRLFLEADYADYNVTSRLNLAITKTKGKYIALIEAGDLWYPHKLAKQLDFLERNPHLGLTHSWLMLIDDRSRSVGKIVKHQLSGWIEAELLQHNQIGFSSAIVRRDCFNQVGWFDPQLQTSFDWDMWIRLSRCYEIGAIAEPLVYHRQKRDRISESWLNKETDLQTIIEKAYRATSPELLKLKHRSYACASLNLAWEVLHNINPDPTIAEHYCRQALEHSPRISFSAEYIQASLAILILRYLKSDRYICFISFLENLRTQQQAYEHRFKGFAHLLLHWMLQEENQNRHQETGGINQNWKRERLGD